MGSAKRTSALGKEALSLKVALAHGALEAVGVVILVQRLHPSVASGNGESTANALGSEEIIPVLLAIGKAILQVKGTVSKRFLAVGTREAIWVPLLVQRIQAVLWTDGVSAIVTRWKSTPCIPL